jgi:hypothetical protein
LYFQLIHLQDFRSIVEISTASMRAIADGGEERVILGGQLALLHIQGNDNMKCTRSNLSRRETLAAMAAAAGGMLFGSTDLFAAETSSVDPRVAQIVSSTIAIDMHN